MIENTLSIIKPDAVERNLEENIKMARTLGMNAYQFVPENYELIFNKANSFFSWDKKCILKY